MGNQSHDTCTCSARDYRGELLLSELEANNPPATTCLNKLVDAATQAPPNGDGNISWITIIGSRVWRWMLEHSDARLDASFFSPELVV